MKRKTAKKLKIVLFTGYACNNNCRFCIEADKRALPSKSTAQLVREVYRAAARGADILEIIGGEAPIRKDFARVVALAKKAGIAEVICATNGRVFSDFKLASAIVKAGIDSLIFSVHGASPRVHDALTRSPGSFRELGRGLANLRRLKFSRINGNTTVVKDNMADLEKVAAFYVKHGIPNVEYIFVDPGGGGAKSDFFNIVPRISEAAPFMRRALDIGRKAGFYRWKARYVPLCHFRGYEEQISEINERALFLTEHWAPDFTNTDVTASRAAVARKKTARCRGCRLYRACEGLWKEYLEIYGDAELCAQRR